MNRFCFIAPTYNASKTLKQAILSLAVQTYQNWKLIVIDDVSTDNTFEVLSDVAKATGEDITNPNSRIVYKKNEEKKWEVANMLTGLAECIDEDIICRMDLDDFLIDAQALEIINLQYETYSDLDATWSMHRWFEEGKLSNFNISKDMPLGSDPYKHPWVSSHFKTFRKKVLKNVKDENYRGSDGEYFKRIGDQVFMLPALKNSRKWLFIPMPFYAYRCSLEPSTFQTEDAKFQAAESAYLRSRGYIS